MSQTVRANVAGSNISRPCTVDGGIRVSNLKMMNSNFSTRRTIRSAADARFFRSKRSVNSFGFKNTKSCHILQKDTDIYSRKVYFMIHNLILTGDYQSDG